MLLVLQKNGKFWVSWRKVEVFYIVVLFFHAVLKKLINIPLSHRDLTINKHVSFFGKKSVHGSLIHSHHYYTFLDNFVFEEKQLCPGFFPLLMTHILYEHCDCTVGHSRTGREGPALHHPILRGGQFAQDCRGSHTQSWYPAAEVFIAPAIGQSGHPQSARLLHRSRLHHRLGPRDVRSAVWSLQLRRACREFRPATARSLPSRRAGPLPGGHCTALAESRFAGNMRITSRQRDRLMNRQKIKQHFTFLISYRLIDWLLYRLTDWLIDWLIDCWLIDWLIDCFIDWLIDWLIDRLIDWLIDWLICRSGWLWPSWNAGKKLPINDYISYFWRRTKKRRTWLI